MVNTINSTPNHIQNEQPQANQSNNKLAKRIVAAALGLISAVGALFALLIFGAPLSIAAGAAVVIGGSVSLITYLTFPHKKNHLDPIDTQSQQIQRKIDSQLQQSVDFSKQLQEQEAKNESEAVAFLQKTIRELNLEKAEFDQNFVKNCGNNNPNDPIMRPFYETQKFALNSKYKLAFHFAASRVSSPEAKARVFAPYQAEYSHLM